MELELAGFRAESCSQVNPGGCKGHRRKIRNLEKRIARAKARSHYKRFMKEQQEKQQQQLVSKHNFLTLFSYHRTPSNNISPEIIRNIVWG
jgi:hypothetical protein